jgi:hypothetical protein
MTAFLTTPFNVTKVISSPSAIEDVFKITYCKTANCGSKTTPSTVISIAIVHELLIEKKPRVEVSPNN